MAPTKQDGLEDEAKALWHSMLNDPKAISDKRGPSKKFQDRVAVCKADMVIKRDAQIKSQGIECRSKETKGARQEDIDKLEAWLSKGPTVKSTASRSRLR